MQQIRAEIARKVPHSPRILVAQRQRAAGCGRPVAAWESEEGCANAAARAANLRAACCDLAKCSCQNAMTRTLPQQRAADARRWPFDFVCVLVLVFAHKKVLSAQQVGKQLAAATLCATKIPVLCGTVRACVRVCACNCIFGANLLQGIRH